MDKVSNKITIDDIIKMSLIAAIYTILSIFLSALSFGPIQIRIAESLTLLCVFSKKNIYAVSFGCFLTNLIGVFIGANILGPLDVIVGTLATFIAGYLTYFLRNIKLFSLPILAGIPPIIINGIFIGAELSFVTNVSFFIMALQIMLQEFVSISIGFIFLKYIMYSKSFEKFILR